MDGLFAIVELFSTTKGGLLVFLGLITLSIGGVWLYRQTYEPSVTHLELIDPDCRDYINLPLMQCRGATKLGITHCRCRTHWVEVVDPQVRSWVIEEQPKGYRIQW